ncbi:Na+:H+ dicarboxylate symporter [Bifidobacterium longum subsp. longum]|nr:Na+:H+ dicarboxylate symporter [Bifidobacterium longum subsp. longum]RHA96581.1 Na+:H+ dicarboxylate symporter [Bifidobacterium longum]MBL3907034.1 Na+:H+ dicarboxylate symporter [Bifidobacterium longum subsp. longum]MBL3912906.1 Na+:H+ dicarboxylate symporter [Bifidobacterium longum subsp. longum]RHG70995.1 Na+:H+ dicarboxylate symporter [Bifidobacterium longum]
MCCFVQNPYLFVALSTLSGLAMAAVTFICSMSYQSESRYMRIAHERYHDELSRNWVSIIAWTTVTAVLPLISLCLWSSHQGVSTAISIYALVMMAAKLGRSIHWMKYTLFIQKASMTIGEPFTDKDMQKVFQRHESNSKTL